MVLQCALFILCILAVCGNPRHNTSSPEFRALANETYARILPCLQARWSEEEKKRVMEFPLDAEEHYHALKLATNNYRNSTNIYESPDGFTGPWIDNIFIDTYLHKPLHHFRGIIPIFIPWHDWRNREKEYWVYIQEVLDLNLRPNVLYMTLTWADLGIYPMDARHKNIFMFSSGGYGHVVCPELKKELDVLQLPEKFEYDLSFYGDISNGDRRHFLPIIEKRAEEVGLTYKIGRGI